MRIARGISSASWGYAGPSGMRMRGKRIKPSLSRTFSAVVGKRLPDVDSDPGEGAQAVAGCEQDERHDKIV
jgi:hypothetical protein